MKKFNDVFNKNNNFIYLILIWATLFLALIFTYAHQGNLLIDCGREAYYPVQILAGKILYKDILNIYGPFSYMLNAVLFKIFGTNLNVLYIAGCVCTFAVSTLIYLITRRFLPGFLSFSIAIFTVIIGVVTPYLSNFIFPYSYGMLYGLVSFLFSIWFLLKYESSEKTHYLYLSSLFAGLSTASKYEFLSCFLVVIFAMIKVKQLVVKEYLISIFSFLSIPILCFSILFLQGLRIENLIFSISILKKIAQSQTLQYFYHRQGVYFSPQFMLIELKNLIMTIVAFALLSFAFNVKNKIVKSMLFVIAFFATLILTTPMSISAIAILTFILAILDFKNLKENLALQILVFSTILFSMKVFWGVITANYGVYFISILLIAFISLIADRFKDKKINYNTIGVYILLLAFVLGFQNWHILKDKRYEIKTNKGKIYTENGLSFATIDLINYIKQNTKKTDEVVILPEGALINFLTDRKSDDFYTSLIPLYIEVFGEDKIIDHFKQTKPEYIVFNNWSTQDYYFKNICEDYALSFCSYVNENYTQKKVIDKGLRYLIYKRK